MQDDKRDDQMAGGLEAVTDEAQVAALDVGAGMVSIAGNPFWKKPEDQTAAKPENQGKAAPKKPAKRAGSGKKKPTVEEMRKERDELKARTKNLSAAIAKEERAEKARKERAERQQEQRIALEFYRKYRSYIEMSKRLKLTSGMTAFEWIEQEIRKGKNRQEG